MATTHKVIDPAAAGDYTTIEAALTALAAVTGDIVLWCAKGACTADTDVPTNRIVELGDLACDSLVIRVIPGNGHYGDLAQAVASCAWLHKSFNWTLGGTGDTPTALRRVELRGLRFDGAGNGGPINLFSMGEGKASGTYTLVIDDDLVHNIGYGLFGGGDGLSIGLSDACVVNCYLLDSCFFSSSTCVGTLPGFIVLSASGGSTINFWSCDTVVTGVAATAIEVDGITAIVEEGSLVNVCFCNTRVFNIAGEACFNLGEGINVVYADYNISSDTSAQTAFGTKNNQNSVASNTYLVTPLTTQCPAYENSTAYQIGDIVMGWKTGGPMGTFYQCVDNAGTSRSSNYPTWATTVGNKNYDTGSSGLRWINIGPTTTWTGSIQQKATSPGIKTGMRAINSSWDVIDFLNRNLDELVTADASIQAELPGVEAGQAAASGNNPYLLIP